MRKIRIVALAIIVLGVCLPALAQSPGTASNSIDPHFFTGVNPRDIQMKNLVNPGKGMKDYQIASSMRKPSPMSAFNLGHIFPKISLGSWPPIVPSTPILGQKNNPYQPNPPKGVNLFTPPAKKK